MDRGHVKIITEDNRTFITFTEKGIKSCEEKIEELQDLNEHFNENPLEQQKYGGEQNWGSRMIKKGAKSTGRHTNTQIDILIQKISRWE
jgi:hypothetical protein